MADDEPADADVRDSRAIMDTADRLQRRELRLAQASNFEEQRAALRERLRALYARRGVENDDKTLERAIDQRLDERLTHEPARGVTAALARAYVWLYNRF